MQYTDDGVWPISCKYTWTSHGFKKNLLFLAFDFCRFCVVIRVFHPRHSVRLRRIFYPRFYPLHLFSYLNSRERASIFPFECLVLNKGTTGTIFITSLVWRCPWLGIEPVTSRTRSQHSTTRLSRGRIHHMEEMLCLFVLDGLLNPCIFVSHIWTQLYR